MANKTFTNIVDYTEKYIRDSQSYATEIGYYVNWMCEKISHQHNFSYFHISNDADLAANAYYLAYPTNCKEIIKLRWLLTTPGSTGIITYKSPRTYIRDHGYPDWTGRGQGTPRFYTVMGDGSGAQRIYFDKDAEQAYKIREWYVEYHPTIATTNPHEFHPDMMGVMAIISGVLFELKDMLTLTPTGRGLAERHQSYTEMLIQADMNRADEEFSIEAYYDSDMDAVFREIGVDPYDWI